MSQTSENFLPANTGQNLGSSGQRWNAVLQDLDVSRSHGIPVFAQSSLPTAGTAGRLARVSDHGRGLWMDNGSAWIPLYPVYNALDFSGADAGLKIQAAHDALPSNAAVIDCRGFGSTEAIGTALTISKQCVLLFGHTTFNVAAPITIFLSGSQLRMSMQGAGPWNTSFSWTGSTSGTMFTIKRVGRFHFSGFRLVNGVSVGTTTGILFTSESASSQTGPGLTQKVFISGFSRGMAIGESTNESASELKFDNLEVNSNASGIVTDGAQTLNVQFSNLIMANNTTVGLEIKNGGHISVKGGSCSSNYDDFITRTQATTFTVENLRSEQITNRFVQNLSTGTQPTFVTIRNCEAQAAAGTPALIVGSTGANYWMVENTRILGAMTPGSGTKWLWFCNNGILAGGANGHPFTDDAATDMHYVSIGNYQMTSTSDWTLSSRYNDTVGKIVANTPTDALSIGTNSLTTGIRFQKAKGATVTAANDLTLGFDGNVFHISGNTTINAITTAQWQAGSEITFIFDGTPTVKHNTAGGAGTAKMLLAGGADLSATANDTLTLVYDGTSWFEKCRAVI